MLKPLLKSSEPSFKPSLSKPLESKGNALHDQGAQYLKPTILPCSLLSSEIWVAPSQDAHDSNGDGR